MVEGNGDDQLGRKIVEDAGYDPDIDEAFKPLPPARVVDKEAKSEFHSSPPVESPEK